jgi:hypothetical protein
LITRSGRATTFGVNACKLFRRVETDHELIPVNVRTPRNAAQNLSASGSC